MCHTDYTSRTHTCRVWWGTQGQATTTNRTDVSGSTETDWALCNSLIHSLPLSACVGMGKVNVCVYVVQGWGTMVEY